MLTRRHKPLFVTALIACLAVLAIQAVRLLSGGNMDETAATAAFLLSGLFGWCLHLTHRDMTTNG